MTKREERRKVAKLTINTDNMYFMGLDIPYDKNIEVLLNGIHEFIAKDINGEQFIETEAFIDEAHPDRVSIAFPHNNNIIQTITDSGMIENPLLFKRWVCAQTFRMLNYKGGKGDGWDAYMKEKLTYAYQFNMLVDEIKRLSKMERDGGHDFEIESKFWTFNTVQQIYRENLINVSKFFREQLKNRDYVVVIYLNNGRKRNNNIKNYSNIVEFIYKYTKLVDKMSEVRSYMELLSIMKELANMPICPRDHAKCTTWKAVYRGYGGFYTLYNLFGWHGVTFKDMNMEESIEHIEDLLKGDLFYNPWKFHYILKDVITENDFKLSDSIARTKRMRIR